MSHTFFSTTCNIGSYCIALQRDLDAITCITIWPRSCPAVARKRGQVNNISSDTFAHCAAISSVCQGWTFQTSKVRFFLGMIFNSLWLRDDIYRHTFVSISVQVTACCLTPPSHYINQCWLAIISIHFPVQFRRKWEHTLAKLIT